MTFNKNKYLKLFSILFLLIILILITNIFKNNWEKDKIKKKQEECKNWWNNYKINLQEDIKNKLI